MLPWPWMPGVDTLFIPLYTPQVWYTLQMTLFLFCQIISYVVKTVTLETKTLLEAKDWDFMKNSETWPVTWTTRPRLDISKSVHFAKIFQKMIITTAKLNFFLISNIFRSVLVVSYLQIQQRENSLNYKSFTKPYPCNIESLKAISLWPRPVAFETKKRPETFKNETCKNGVETETRSRRLHQWK